MNTSTLKTHARICELYLGEQMTLVDISKEVNLSVDTVSRTIDRILKYKKITDIGTEMITIQSKINNQIKE